MSTATASAIAPLPLDDSELEELRESADTPVGDDRRNGSGGARNRRNGALSANVLDDLLGPGNYSNIARDANPPLSISHVSRVLRGHSKPSLDVARRIANAAGITLDELQPWLERRQSSPMPSSRPRSSKPIVNPNAKLDIDKAREIRVKAAEGATLEELAEDYDVTKQAISDVVRGISYPVDS